MASRIRVMLGVPDEKISFEDDISNAWTTNKFGGIPNWINRAPDVLPRCNLCNDHLPMVAQIYCPLNNSLYHRVLYLFGCVNTCCWNKSESWKVLRCQSMVKDDVCMKDENEIQNEDDWCDDADSWGEEESFEETNTVTKLEEQTRNLNLSENEHCNNKLSSETTNDLISQRHDAGCTHVTELQSTNTIHFVPYYITVLEESQLLDEAAELTWSEKRLLNKYTASEGIQDIEGLMDGNARGDWGGEKYEMSVAKHGDKIFQKFKKQLSLCPNQCLRYSWNGEPLLMTSQGLGTIPSCNSCGEKRVFELQLMPALVSLLKTDSKRHKTTSLNENNVTITQHTDLKNLSSECIEFGTIFVYTCSKGCWSEDVSFLEEYLIVHSDPDQHLFKNEK